MPSKKRFFGGLVGANPLRSGSFQDPGAVDRVSSNEGVLSIDTAGPESSTTTITTLGDYSTKSETQFTATSATSGDQFGHSAAMSGDGTIVVFGAIGQDTTATDSGAAYVYENGTQVAILKASDAGASDNFGTDVAISKDGSVIVVGAPLWDATGASDAGAVYVYVKPSGGWTTTSSEDAKLTRSSPYSLTYLGSGVAISDDGNTIVASAYMDPTDLGLGGAYVYQKPGSGWTSATETAALTGSDVTESDRLGHGLAISGDGTVIALGAPYADEPDSNCGVVYVYDRSGSTWSSTTETHKVGRISTSGNHYLGWSCALNEDGTILVAGAPGVNSSQGFLFVFEDSGGTWSESKILVLNPGSAANQELGDDVAISRDGSLIIAGVPGYSGVVTSGGALAVWEAPATGGWANRSSTAHDYIITDSNTSSSDNLGGRHIDYEYLPHTIALSNDGRKALAGVRSAGTAGDGILFTATGGNPGTTTTTTTQTTQWFWGGLRGRDAIVAGSGQAGDDKSLRFDGTNDYLNKVVSASNRTTWTWSAWVKKDDLSRREYLFSGGAAGDDSNLFYLQWERNHTGANSQLGVVWREATPDYTRSMYTTASYNDTSAWYHVVLSVDTTQSAASDKMKLYIDGTEITSFSTDQRNTIGTNDPLSVNAAGNLCMGAYAYDLSATGSRFQGLMAEVHFIDGTAYDASYFGETRDGVWVPKEVTGLTYGNNGFYLDFAGNDTGVTLLLDGSSPTTDLSSVENTITNDTGVSVTNISGPYGSAQDVLSFDGTSDTLTFDIDTTMQLAGDFTIEAWVKRASAGGGTGDRECLWSYWGNGTDGARCSIQFEKDTDKVSFYDNANHLDFDISTTNAFVDDTWFHIAIVRSGSTYECFVDGLSLGTNTGTTTTFTGGTSQSNKARIGALVPGSIPFVGEIADFRITKGYVRYSGSFTPPTSALSADVSGITGSDDVVLMLNGESSTIADVSSNTSSNFTNNGIVQNTNTSNVKYGTGSLEFDGVDDYATFDMPELDGDYTIEFWYKPKSLSGDHIVLDMRTATNTGYPIIFTDANGPTNYAFRFWHNSTVRINTTTVPVVDKWMHVAVVRRSGVTRMFINGTQEGASYTNSSTFSSDTSTLGRRYVQDGGGNTYPTDAYIDDIRITKGAALYPFHPPIAALTNTPEYLGDFGVDRTTNSNDFSVEGNITPDDQLIDTPNLRFASFNPAAVSQSGLTISEANLQVSNSATNWRGIRSDFSIPENSKVYYEWVNPTGGDITMVGVTTTVPSSTSWYPGLDTSSWGAFEYSPNSNQLEWYHNGSSVIFSASNYTVPNYAVAMCAVDRSNGKIHFGIDGEWWTSTSTKGLFNGFTPNSNFANLPSTGALYPALGALYNSNISFAGVVNFGQDHTFAGTKSPLLTPYSDANGVGEFYYEPPSGFLALADNYVVTNSLATTGVLSVSEMLQASL